MHLGIRGRRSAAPADDDRHDHLHRLLVFPTPNYRGFVHVGMDCCGPAFWRQALQPLRRRSSSWFPKLALAEPGGAVALANNTGLRHEIVAPDIVTFNLVFLLIYGI